MQFGQEKSERPPLPGSGHMENYTGAFLVSAGVLCFFLLCTLWAMFGLPFVITLAILTERLFLRG